MLGGDARLSSSRGTSKGHTLAFVSAAADGKFVKSIGQFSTRRACRDHEVDPLFIISTFVSWAPAPEAKISSESCALANCPVAARTQASDLACSNVGKEGQRPLQVSTGRVWGTQQNG